MLLTMCHLYLVDSSKNNDDDYDDVAWCLVMMMVMMKSMQAMHKRVITQLLIELHSKNLCYKPSR